MAALMASSAGYAQPSRSVVIGTMTSRPNALLVLNPPGDDQGFLLPQLTTAERNSITPGSPAEDGLLVFDITEKSFYYWKEGQWTKNFGANTTVSPGTYGSATSVSQFTVDAQGRITSAANVPISVSSGGATAQSYSIDPSDFSGLRTNSKKDKDNALIFEDNTAFVGVFKKDEGTSLIAPIHLPDGAVIQQILFYYMDRDAQNLALSVMRRAYTGNNDPVIPTWNSTGNSSSVQTSMHAPSPGKEVIDNSLYSYRVIINLNPTSDANDSNDPTHRVYGLQIKYVK